MRYEGRREAGLVLAGELRRLDLGPCVVAGIPWGGMVVAAAVAEHLPINDAARLPRLLGSLVEERPQGAVTAG